MIALAADARHTLHPEALFTLPSALVMKCGGETSLTHAMHFLSSEPKDAGCTNKVYILFKLNLLHDFLLLLFHSFRVLDWNPVQTSKSLMNLVPALHVSNVKRVLMFRSWKLKQVQHNCIIQVYSSAHSFAYAVIVTPDD